MRKLYLVHPIGKLSQRTFGWIEGKQTWTVDAHGTYVLTVGDEEYVLPATSVAYESRPAQKTQAKRAS